MEKLYINIKQRRIALKMSQTELAHKVGYTDRSTIAKVEAGQIDLTQPKIMAFAKALNTTPGKLLGWVVDPEPIASNIIPVPAGRRIPVVGTIACGSPILAQENIQGYVDTDKAHGADFALICRGDSMAPKILDGDVVLIRQQPTVDNGQVAAVLIGDEATLKKVYLQDNQLVLVPENGAYSPLVYTGQDMASAQVLGLVVGFTRWLAD